MILLVIAVEALIILVLLGALLYGQPASTQADRDQITANATVISAYRAVPPTPTLSTCYGGGTGHC